MVSSNATTWIVKLGESGGLAGFSIFNFKLFILLLLDIYIKINLVSGVIGIEFRILGQFVCYDYDIIKIINKKKNCFDYCVCLIFQFWCFKLG